jgi:hypothetical protein
MMSWRGRRTGRLGDLGTETPEIEEKKQRNGEKENEERRK